jgi:hypothetical protein
MARLSKQYADILTRYGESEKSAVWDCHGTMVIYHKALERIATKAGIHFPIEKMQIIEADAKLKIATMIVVGVMNDQEEWSVGEASPSNNKNSYPWAMCEKRAKDRVVLKLIGLHGEIYSEEEADDFKPQAPVNPRDGVGIPPEKPDSFELIDEFGEVANTHTDAKTYMTVLAGKVRENGKWWPNNRDLVTYIGKTSETGSELHKQSRLLWTMGEEASKNVNQ